MSNWVWSVTQENWPTVKHKKVWAVASIKKGSRMAKGDKIIFYVNGTMLFHGIYEIASDWHEPTVEWPDHSDSYGSEINLEEIQVGFADVQKLLNNLEFIEKKKSIGAYLRGSSRGGSNYGKPISDNDLSVILKELELVQQIPLQEERTDIDVKEMIPVNDWDFIDQRLHDLSSPNLRTMEYIIDEIQKGRIAIPSFQRDSTWTRRQVEELWESVFQGFFIGSILTWKSNESFELDPVHGGPSLDNPTDVILDGQQRITSLYYAVMAPDIDLPKMQSTRFFVDLNSLLNPNASATDIVVSFHKSRAEQKGYLDKKTQFRKKLFPISEFNKKNYTEWCFLFEKHLQENEDYSHNESEAYRRHILDILTHVWQQFRIPIIQLPESMNLDSVAEIFEKINSTGTNLGVFDLLNARFTGYGIDLKMLWRRAKEEYDNIAMMNKEINKDAEKMLLQAMCLYKKGYSRRKELLSLDSAYRTGIFQKDLFEADWDKICGFTSKAVGKIMSQRRSGFGAVKFSIIPYTVTIPILAALLYKISGRPDEPKCMNKIETWYWATVFSDSYSGSTDSKIEKDFREVQQWFEDESAVPRIILNQQSGLEDAIITDAKKNSSVYKAIMCIISKKGGLDFVNDQPLEHNDLDDHHIFPKSKKYQHSGNTSPDSILNKTLIDRNANRKFIRDQDPSDYLKNIMKTQGVNEAALKRRLETHLISSEAFDCMLQDNFDGFVKERRNQIKKEYKKTIFPEPYREDDIYPLLHKNESQSLEYKSSMRWDVRQDKQSPVMEGVVAKELCAFMNAGGGNLLIGVDDGGTPIGLKKDYSTFKNKNADSFAQHMTNLITKYLGKISNSYVELSFHIADGMEICLCKIKHASSPIYLTKNNEKLFYVRLNNTVQPLDMEDAHKYILENWR